MVKNCWRISFKSVLGVCSKWFSSKNFIRAKSLIMCLIKNPAYFKSNVSLYLSVNSLTYVGIRFSVFEKRNLRWKVILNFTLVVKTYYIFKFFMPQFEVKVSDLISPRIAVILVMKNKFFRSDFTQTWKKLSNCH